MAGTATTSAGKAFGVPVLGTMAHSFVQSFDNEYEAFKAYAQVYPDACVLLVDTYDTLKSGVPNAIKVAEDVYKRQLVSGKTHVQDFISKKQVYTCLLYTSRCV